MLDINTYRYIFQDLDAKGLEEYLLTLPEEGLRSDVEQMQYEILSELLVEKLAE